MPSQFFGQVQRQSQSQKLSQVMIQSIGLLSNSTDELREKIYTEAEKNPALEIVRDGKLSTVTDYSASFSGSAQSDNFQSFLENSSVFEETLQEHLLSQLGELKLSKREEEAAETIIQNLNGKGYHIIPLENLFPSRDYPIAMKMLRLIQQFDPIGVAVKDLQESLYIQAKAKGADDFTLIFIKYHLQLLETIRLPLIVRKLSESGIKTSEAQIEDVISFIRTLEPYPAQDFATGRNSVGGEGGNFISPDVRVVRSEKDEKSEYYAELIKENLPIVKLNEEYLKLKGKEAKDNILAAKNFINSIETRNETLEKVANLIVKVQNDFFDKGAEALKPLKMKDVAEKVGVHESTISRIARRKYLLCDRGTFALRYFFTGEAGSRGLTSRNRNVAFNESDEINESDKKNSGTSKEAVKAIIARLIAENDAQSESVFGKAKISDQKLCDLLEKQGIKIARRTVAKYRAELNIQSSYDR
ncbi:MAG: RNA polymerase factor sigma-54 [Treponemataceae bacterium]|nr:RNA polymerase factor sigma-54 [Treponemataceae bacterium]